MQHFDGAFHLLTHDTLSSEANQPVALGQIARAHENADAGCDAPRRIDDTLGGLRVVHQEHQQPCALQMRVAQSLCARGVAVVDG